MKTKFIPIDYDYFDYNGRNIIKIIGRDEKNRKICILDSCPIYLWAILKKDTTQDKIKKIIKKIEKIEIESKGRTTTIEKTELQTKNFLGKKVDALKIFATNYKDLHDIADQLDMPEIEKRRGYDLGFITHYIIEKEVTPLEWIEIEGKVIDEEYSGIAKGLDVDFCVEVEKISKTKEEEFKPKVLAYDIETDEIDLGKGEILMISLVSEKFKKLITWKKTEQKIEGVEFVENEAELITRFVDEVKKFSPDFLVGYFTDGFDLPYLKLRAEKNKIKLNLGIDDSEPKIFKSVDSTTGRIKGITHIDVFKFIRTAYSQYMESETLSLNEVAKEFLGDSKKDFKIKHSSKIEQNEWEEYYDYCIQDSNLSYLLFEKFWPDIREFSRIIKEPAFEISRNGMSSNVESYILQNLKRFDEIPEKKPGYNEIGERKEREKYEGAFVFEPTPGLYEKIAIFDFTSSYGSVIVSYNLSKSTYLEENKKDAYCIESLGKKLCFDKKPGFVPEILREIIEKRKKFKKELKENPDVIKKARSNAFKLLANAYYGYQGFFGARYYSLEAAAATAAFARKEIQEVIDKINQSGFKTIYSDTDSIAFLRNGKSELQVNEILKKINAELPGIMELELEGFFERGIWVSKRSGEVGAKKKYALIDNKNKLKIRGFETVRRDWCKLARNVQKKVLKLVLEEGNEKKAIEFLKEVVKKLKSREIPLEELIIRTQLKKALSEYKAISPHVIAAQKMKEQKKHISEGGLVEYYIAETEKKTKLVREKVKLPEEKGEYEIDYYLNKQILPAVENIMQVFGIKIQEILENNKQEGLNKWF